MIKPLYFLIVGVYIKTTVFSIKWVRMGV